ncbi:sulfotransferase [Flagellimonas myxillae]|uniref:sulfotransferase n=1 Tax=Flagellimonas myxillae TaxID=2942214 RepID=UPI00201E99DA|nr:sulfotransferase [Muricauda myxillae]MCL6266663.1 sulfotransferase [Muricauda myxillae]
MDKTLIYILGAGRSGTTILDILLGNSQDTISIGEVSRFCKRQGIPPKREKEDPVFGYWDDVRRTFEREGFDYTKGEESVTNHEYHTHFVKAVFGKHDQEYIDIIQEFYKAVFDRTKEAVLIESSKYPLRAMNLSKIFNGDSLKIKYIYLKKDPIQVVRSFNKKNIEQPPKGFLLSNIYYLTVNLICLWTVKILRRRKHAVAIVKYDDLVAQPIKTLDDIAMNLGENFDDSKQKIANNRPLYTGFLFDGNRIRLQQEILLRSKTETRKLTLGDYFTKIFNYLVYR